MVDIDAALTAWHERLFGVLMVLEDIELRGTGFSFDYSRESLAVLERHVGGASKRPARIEGVAAYLGEALMRAAGGSWTWSAEAVHGFPDGVPLATADPALGLEPVSTVALARRGGGFVEIHDRWTDAVRERRRADDAWRPVKERTRADDPEPDSPYLTAWLARRASAFETWAVTYGAGETWRFDPDSLTRLSELVRRTTPTVAELNDPAHGEFRVGAAWYLGEVLRRHVGGRWNYNDRRSAPDNHPYLDRLGPQHLTSWPFVALEIALEDPEYLRGHFSDCSE